MSSLCVYACLECNFVTAPLADREGHVLDASVVVVTSVMACVAHAPFTLAEAPLTCNCDVDDLSLAERTTGLATVDNQLSDVDHV